MRKIILTAAVIFAVAKSEARTHYYCDELNPNGKTYLTMSMVDQSKNGLSDGEKATFLVEVLENDNISDGSVVYYGQVTAHQEDVQVWMSDKKKTIRITHYLDDDDQTVLTLNGKKTRFQCGSESEE